MLSCDHNSWMKMEPEKMKILLWATGWICWAATLWTSLTLPLCKICFYFFWLETAFCWMISLIFHIINYCDHCNDGVNTCLRTIGGQCKKAGLSDKWNLKCSLKAYFIFLHEDPFFKISLHLFFFSLKYYWIGLYNQSEEPEGRKCL